MPTANDIHDLVAPYALDALDAEERAEFERHLEGCDRCTRELRDLQESATSLAWASAGPEPPADLRGRILESARSEAQVVPLRPRRRWVDARAGRRGGRSRLRRRRARAVGRFAVQPARTVSKI